MYAEHMELSCGILIGIAVNALAEYMLLIFAE
jgi:hypothetical protein